MSRMSIFDRAKMMRFEGNQINGILAEGTLTPVRLALTIRKLASRTSLDPRKETNL